MEVREKKIDRRKKRKEQSELTKKSVSEGIRMEREKKKMAMEQQTGMMRAGPIPSFSAKSVLKPTCP